MPKVDIGGLAVSTTATELDLGDVKRRLKTLPDLRVLPKLRQLTIRGHTLASLDGIEGAKKLWHVTIESRVKDLSALASLPKLEVLWLAGKRTSFADVPTLPALRSLIAQDVSLKTLAGVGRFRGLKVLNVQDNKLTDLAGIASLKLEFVSISENQVRSLRGLPPTVTGLHAVRNRLVSLEGIEKLAKLHRLYVDGNKIARIDRLAAMTKLEILSLSDNAITRVENLEKLRSLRMLDIDGNDITSVSTKTAAWLRSRKSSFQLHLVPEQLRANITRLLASMTIS